MTKVIGDWVINYRCVECSYNMSYNTMMGSHGVCPSCGHNEAGTVCKTKEVVVRYIKTYKGWHQRLRGLYSKLEIEEHK